MHVNCVLISEIKVVYFTLWRKEIKVRERKKCSFVSFETFSFVVFFRQNRCLAGNIKNKTNGIDNDAPDLKAYTKEHN